MMVRTQISLDSADLEAAKQRAGALGISLAELVRRALRREMEAAPRTTDISAIFGIVGEREGQPIAPEDIDRIVGDALLAEQKRWREGIPEP